MIKKLTLLIILCPIYVFSQSVETKDGALIIDFKKKEKKEVEKREFVKPDDPIDKNSFDQPKPKEKREEEPVDLNNESLFKGLFSAGLNISQVDGDDEAGFRKVGAYAGIGTLVKFHKNFSVSMEFIYSMRGAKPQFRTYLDQNGQEQRNKFDITYDYIDIPLSLNIHDKRFVMFGVGLAFGSMVRFKETNPFGIDTTNAAAPYVQPRRFDLAFQTGFSFLIKEQIGIGIKFQYSLLGLRPSYGISKVQNQYNNTITIRVSYILDPKKMKYRKQRASR
jgi:hypothetical protein